ncbi:MAG TPA: M48 family metalloprotease [Candidatus Sulfotelmatobacter sp.]|nr:M48 family metalloprotease [Candidatus Sulfotelmatobacter sp.]
MLRRLSVIALSLAVLCASTPAPALALSTQQEIQIGKEYDKQITDSTVVVTDPLLNQWINDVSNKLWAETARKDVPYSIKILDVNDINAFSTLGGYIYINLGTLDFVQSDDELAGVIGHETGHIERRHVVTSANKATIINILFGIGALFSPLLYRFGQLAEAGILARISRDDENQADQYGLLLMSRAGYDPDAMKSFMAHLGAVEHEGHGALDKYLADHPEVDKRLANLDGDPGLNPQTRTDEQRTAQAIHDFDTARYNIAAMKFTGLLAKHPDDATVRFDLGQSQLALGQTSKGEQNLAAAAQQVSPQAKALADVRIKALRDAEARLDLMHPNLEPLKADLQTARDDEAQAQTAIALRRQQGLDQLKQLTARLQNILFGMPNLASIQPRPGTRLETVIHNLNTMSKSLDEATNKGSMVLSGVGTLERYKQGGLLKDNADMLDELEAPLKLAAPPPQALAVFPDYPRMLGRIGAADADMVRAVDAERAALAKLDVGAGTLDAFVRQLTRTGLMGNGDVRPDDYKQLEPLMSKAVDALNAAAVGASQGAQLYNMARCRQLETRIDMLGLQESPDRYATFQHALDVRFHAPGPSYDQLSAQDLSPADIAAATIVGADTNATGTAILAEATASAKPVVDVANERGMDAQSLEIFLGLVYLDWTDDPAKEALDRT